MELPEYATRDSFGFIHVSTAAEAIKVSPFIEDDDTVIVDDEKQAHLLNLLVSGAWKS